MNKKKQDNLMYSNFMNTGRHTHICIVVLYLLLGVLLLSLLPVATTINPARSPGWYSAPWMAPFLGLFLMVGALGVHVLLIYKQGMKRDAVLQSIWLEYVNFTKILRISILFLLYIFSVLYVGYVLSTLMFCYIFLHTAELKGGKYMFIALGITVMTIFIFRYVLNIWLPVPEWYGQLPSYLSTFFIKYG